MDYCSRQCIRRTLYAVMVGISPICICLVLIAIARLILHRLEISYNRRQKLAGRRRSSSILYQTGRPTLLYTPVSLTELHRIIQGEYHSPRPSESSTTIFNHDNDSPRAPHFIKSILPKHEPTLPAKTLSNLVIRRNAISSTPMTALFAPTQTVDTINEQQRPNLMTIKHESVETTTLATNNQFFDASDTTECEISENDQLLTSPPTLTTTTTTTTVVVEEFLDFHSVHSIPYSLNLVNSILEHDFK